MERFLSIPWRRRSRSRTRSPRPAASQESSPSIERAYGTRFARTEAADRLVRGRSLPVGLLPEQLDRVKTAIRAGYRALSAGELGAKGRARTGPGFRSPFAHAARVPPRRAWQARPLCERCRRQRPGERIRCILCQRRVGPGCTPGCLLVEWRRVSRERVGLCTDWPRCGQQSGDSWTEAARAAVFPPEDADPRMGRAPGPTATAAASRWLKITIILVFVLGRVVSIEASEDSFSQNLPSRRDYSSLNALGLIQEA